MRVALFSDIHGNLPALEAATAAALEAGVSRFVISGDLVGSGPFPRETVDFIRERDDVDVIRGNVDRKVVKAGGKSKKKLQKRLYKGRTEVRNRAWTALQLSNSHLEWLSDLPTCLELCFEGVRVYVFHGSPWGDTDYVYPSITPEGLRRKLEPLDGAKPDLLVSGHSHIPFTKPVNDMIVVNCGSLGRPADGDPRGAFALAEFEKGFPPRVEIVRFAYPLDDVVAALRERQVPGVDPDEYRRGVK